MPFWKRRQEDDSKKKGYASPLPAPRLFAIEGRVVVKLLESKNAGLVIQTIGRVNRGDVTSAFSIEDAVVGSGHSGTVRVATHRYNGRTYAIKTFVKGLASKEQVNLLRNEAQVLLKLDHPHVARLTEVWEDNSAVHFIMEYCSQGDLFTWLAGRRSRATNYAENEAVARVLMSQMLRAVLYLHTQNIVHRDIKLDHWLIDGCWSSLHQGRRPDIPYVKLIDFGLARSFAPRSRPMRASCGTLPYVAPEVLEGAYDAQCDIWALGVVAYMLITGDPPFYGDEAKIARDILSGPEVCLPRRAAMQVSAECQDFVKKCLRRNPRERPTAKEAFNHPWILPRPRLSPGSISLPAISKQRLFEELPRTLASAADYKFFRKLVLALMAFGLTSDEMIEARDLFTFLDKSGEGTVACPDLEVFVAKLDPSLTSQQAQNIAKSLDVFNRGSVFFNDLLCVLLGGFLPLDESLIRTTFWKFDRRRIGVISVDNMRDVLGTLYGDKTLKAFLKETDRSGDSIIGGPMCAQFCSIRFLRLSGVRAQCTSHVLNRSKTRKRAKRFFNV
eukprot:Gregarina_sp_Poly_1__10699@NODE_80_length_15637_cov_125_963134_g68_i0_p2_GENE_NODE_80_length_15637_cov_125_963134_g68_i0NODE_80_length_15637_cov_125_963134_g68_i0_p2_ORF_typecomplete_len557_score71_48Pkinase/PF00069_25/2_6e67Pkinase_Tyr/PF07714_17/1_1e44Kinaselike/PF14531_6/3_2e14Pkinase_fungal/PF17667_1/1_6e08EFhand_7/PF13499_6/0_0091EFhand_7/PF13499_6/0_0087Kdo/PF06293_14/3_2e07Kdo/PF06293_14/7_4e02EFhand_11/PF08976_11/1EFhand_11/PF08976_11/0_39FTA2/PF13095_6/0_69FTA2/PF13095_6/1e04EFhand_8/PF